jgi:protein-disulfide isomerase
MTALGKRLAKPAMIVAAALFVWGAAPAASAQISRADVEAAMQRSFGYDPDVHWQILDIRPSKISGLTEVVVSMNRGEPTKLYVSAGGNAIVGDIIPFGADPFAPARAKLRSADGPKRNAGPVDLVIFSNFDCAHCKVAEPVLNRLAGDFPEVRQIFVQFPLPANLYPWAHQAALWADCIGRADPKAFWSFADAVFAEQDKITADTVDSTLGGLAEQQGLNRGAVAKCVASPEAEAHVRASTALGKQLDVDAVPAVFLNGRRVVGPADIGYENLKQLVRFEIDHAGH